MASLPADLPVVDHHAHLHPSHEGVEAARRFRAAGGTHLFLATQSYEAACPMGLEGYRRQFETTEALARQIGGATELVVYVVVAPYPIDLLAQIEQLGLEAAVALQESALELAGRWIEEQRAVALGEVGRPHFPVDPSVGPAVEGVFRRALEVARDVRAPAVVHCEDLDADGYRGLASFAATVGFPVGRLVKHYARSFVPAPERLGIVPSFLARREAVHDARGDPGPWFLETDFLDDPRRPGAVLDIATVPRRAVALAGEGPAGVELLHRIFVDSVRTVYGFAPQPPGRGTP
jgi:TatD-related deoxyribonuclease